MSLPQGARLKIQQTSYALLNIAEEHVTFRFGSGAKCALECSSLSALSCCPPFIAVALVGVLEPAEPSVSAKTFRRRLDGASSFDLKSKLNLTTIREMITSCGGGGAETCRVGLTLSGIRRNAKAIIVLFVALVTINK